MTLNRRHLLAATGTAPLWLGGCGGSAASAPGPSAAAVVPPVTAPPFGWAGVAQTTGGNGALPEHVFDVRDRDGLAAALRAGSAPKIIRVHGLIDLGPMDGGDFLDPAFDADAYNRAFDPATWGRADPSGPLEDARRRSARRQAEAIIVRVPSNTTLQGAGPGAGFQRGMLMLDRSSNVVIRNLSFSDAYDHFPGWEPRDNLHGEWNSAYDNLSLSGAERVWVDHCHFDDGRRPDALEPTRLGRPVQHHDGLLDITDQSDLVTVSWCRFQAHDKAMLLGNNDALTADDGKLRVTLHHNHFQACRQRTPRVRYGRVHVASNLFTVDRADGFSYSLGVGIQSRLVADSNTWQLPAGIGAGQLIQRFNGSAFAGRDNRYNGQPVDLLAAWQAAHAGETLSADVGWRPEDFYDTTPLRSSDPEQIRNGAGPEQA